MASNPTNLPDAVYRTTHTCPTCGTVAEFIHYLWPEHGGWRSWSWVCPQCRQTWPHTE